MEGHAHYDLPLEEAVDICKKVRGVVPLGSGTYTARHEGLDPQTGKGNPCVDVPAFHSSLVEDRDPFSPLGAKGIGEPAPLPTVPAIINAIYDAVGVRITSLPASPEKILNALSKQASPVV